MPELPSGVVAFLFADLERAAGSWDTDYQQTAADIDHMVETLREAALAQDGSVFKVVGETAQAAFPDVPRALHAAIAAQREISRRWLPDQLPRIALHVGEATPRNGDYLAPALNRLARLTAASHAGQILLSNAALERLGAPPDGIGVQDLGHHRLRDLMEAEAVFQIAAPGLPQAFPPLRSLNGSPHNLPVQPSRLVGREADLTRVRDALRAGERLMTLIGPGGVGKTRLSLQVGADELENFPDGVWWVPLASVTDPQLVLESIASAMPVRLPPNAPMSEALPQMLRSRRDLLILDNLEQLPGAAPIIGQLLADAPSTVVLATSRLPLGLPNETEILIQPLPVPESRGPNSIASAFASPAVRLFVERAQAVRTDFELRSENVRDVVAICDRLDGLPLAIELAAARVRVLAPDALLSRLDRSLQLLTGGARDLPARQQTLRGAIQWSYDLLTPAERTEFARLAVMAPGFTTDAAARTLREFSSYEDVAATLQSLTDQSLLRSIPASDSATRWDMLATIHDFAVECLRSLPEADELRLAHARTYLAIVAESEWFEVTNEPALAASFEADLDNFRAALQSLQSQGDSESLNMLSLATMLADFWWIRGHTTEGRQWLASAISGAPGEPSLDLGRALAAAGLLAESQSDLSAARDFQERALAVFRGEGFASGVADSLTGLAVIARAEGDLTRARLLHQEAFDMWTALGDEQGAAGALLDIGAIGLLRGDLVNAEPILRDALDRFHAVDDLAGEALARQSLAVVNAMSDRLEEAVAGFQATIAMWQSLGNDQMVATDRMNLAELLLLQGEISTAQSMLLDATVQLADIADPARQGSALNLLGRSHLAQGQASEAEAMQRDALKLTWEHRDLSSTVGVLDALAETAATLGDRDLGREILFASEQLRVKSGLMRLPQYTRRLTEALGGFRRNTGEEFPALEKTIERVIYRGLRR